MQKTIPFSRWLPYIGGRSDSVDAGILVSLQVGQASLTIREAPAQGQRLVLGRYGGLLFLIILLGATARLTGLSHTLNYDEVLSTKFASIPQHLLWSHWMVRETTPPLYYSLLKLWMSLVGDSDEAIRLLSAVVGIVSIPIIYCMGRDADSKEAGLLAAILFASSGTALIYGQQVRNYGLGHLASLISLWSAFYLLKSGHQPSWRSSAVFVLSTATALYSHTTLLVLVILVNIFALIRLTQLRANVAVWIRWVTVNIAVLLIWSWWAAIVVQQGAHPLNTTFMQRPSPYMAYGIIMSDYGPWLSPRAFTATLIVGLLLLALWRLRARPGFLYPFAAIGAPLLLFLMSQHSPIMAERTLYWATGPAFLAFAIGLCAVPNAILRYVLLAFLVIGGVRDVLWQKLRDNASFEYLTSEVSRIAPGALVMTADLDYHLQRYCRNQCPLTIEHFGESWLHDSFGGPEATPETITGALKDGRPVISVERHPITGFTQLGLTKQFLFQRAFASDPGASVYRLTYRQPTEGPAQ